MEPYCGSFWSLFPGASTQGVLVERLIGMWTLVGIIGGVLLAALIGLIVYGNVRRSMQTRHLDRYGEKTHAWIVVANNGLYEKGEMALPALVLLSPDKTTNKDEAYMDRLTEKIHMLLDGEADSDEEEEVAE